MKLCRRSKRGKEKRERGKKRTTKFYLSLFYLLPRPLSLRTYVSRFFRPSLRVGIFFNARPIIKLSFVRYVCGVSGVCAQPSGRVTSSVVNDTRIEHEHRRRRVDRPWKRNDETARGRRVDDWREIEIMNGSNKDREENSRRGRIGNSRKRYESWLNACVKGKRRRRKRGGACEQVHGA